MSDMHTLILRSSFESQCAHPYDATSPDWRAHHFVDKTYDDLVQDNYPRVMISMVDELPAFSIRSISPNQRSPSPIDFDTYNISGTPQDDSINNSTTEEHVTDCSDNMVSLDELNAQIQGMSCNWQNGKRLSGLETIYEGKFLDTPTKRHRPAGTWMQKVRAIDVAGHPSAQRGASSSDGELDEDEDGSGASDNDIENTPPSVGRRMDGASEERS